MKLNRFYALALTISLLVLNSLFVSPQSHAAPAQRIVFASDRGGSDMDIYSMNLDGTDVIQLTSGSANDFAASWSPDGKKISFTRSEADITDIYIMNADGTNVTNITNSPEEDGWMIWSPDSTKILFSSAIDGSIKAWSVANADGSGKITLSTSSSSPLGGWWSQDSSRILLYKPVSGIYQIFTMNSDGTNQQQLTSDIYDSYFASWSPDGKKIAFVKSLESKMVLFTMNSDGTNQQQLAEISDTNSHYGLPIWSPDSTKIVYSGLFNDVIDTFFIDINKSSPIQVTHETSNSTTGSVGVWANNTEIIVAFRSSNNLEIALYNTSTSEFTNITNNSGNDIFYLNSISNVVNGNQHDQDVITPHPTVTQTPSAPRTGGLIFTTIVSVSFICVVLIIVKEVRDRRHR